jgi:hypothetical protein
MANCCLGETLGKGYQEIQRGIFIAALSIKRPKLETTEISISRREEKP